MASNSLTEAAYFGARAASHALAAIKCMEEDFPGPIEGIPAWQSGTAVKSKDEVIYAYPHYCSMIFT